MHLSREALELCAKKYEHPTDYMVSEETIDKWEDNFENYISFDDDHEGYKSQPVEVDARNFEVGR